MKEFLLIAAALLGSSLARDLDFGTCQDDNDEPVTRFTSVTLINCPNENCELAVGDDVNARILFQVDGPVPVIQINARVLVDAENDVWVDFPLDLEDPCLLITGGCPDRAGEYSMFFGTSTASFEPGMVTGRLEIANAMGSPIACGVVSLELEGSVSTEEV